MKQWKGRKVQKRRRSNTTRREWALNRRWRAMQNRIVVGSEEDLENTPEIYTRNWCGRCDTRTDPKPTSYESTNIQSKMNHNWVAKKTWIRIKIQRALIWSEFNDRIGYWKTIRSRPRKSTIAKPVYKQPDLAFLQINRLEMPILRRDANEFVSDRSAKSISLLASTTIQRTSSTHFFP